MDTMQWASIMDRTAEAPCNPCVNPSLTSTCAAESPCDPCVNLSLTSTCAAPAALNGSTLLFSREEGEEGRGECVVGARGRTRTAESPCNPCVNPSLTSTCAAPAALNGSPLQSGHALLSSLFSLFSTLHYLKLISVPFFNHPRATSPKTNTRL